MTQAEPENSTLLFEPWEPVDPTGHLKPQEHSGGGGAVRKWVRQNDCMPEPETSTLHVEVK